MNYIVMDLEWNQAASYGDMVKEPVFLTGEIIQIGAVKLGEDLDYADSFQCRVAPEYYRELHPKVEAITGLSREEMLSGTGFAEAYGSFLHWMGEDCVLLVWGTEDLPILRKNLSLHGIGWEALPRCFNLQDLFAAQISHDSKQLKLHKALAMVKERPLPAHDALNDAVSTSLLCRHLNMAQGLAEYRDIFSRRDGVVEQFDFEELYEDAGDVLSDDFVISFECPDCGEIVWGEDWTSRGAGKLLSNCRCRDGQEFQIELRLCYRIGGGVTVKRRIFQLSEERRQLYDECVHQAELWNRYVVSATV